MEKRILSSSSGEELEISRVYKRNKKEEDEHVDIISHLPEPLLHHIFSFLDIKQAIQTCILSRRWRCFWVSLPTLNFNYTKRGTVLHQQTRKKGNFKDFVDWVLIHRDKSTIQKLVMVTNGHNCDVTDHLNSWIFTLIIRKIQQLSLHIYTARESWHFPDGISFCKSLTKLVLGPFGKRKCTTIVLSDSDVSITLPRLKTLSLESVRFRDKDSIDRFVSEECLPVLETLILINFNFPYGGLNISSLKLKHLKLESRLSSYYDSIHLHSPNLLSFYYNGCMFKHCVLENLSSLVKADIYVIKMPMVYSAKEICDAHYTVTVLRELHNAEELTLSTKFIKIASGALKLLDNHSTRFSKLKCLKLEGSKFSIDCIRVISYLLIASPNLENLSVTLWHPSPCTCMYCKKANSNSANKGDCWGAGLSLDCLKFFKFQNVTACANELKFIEILLSKAMLLEKLIIVFGFEKNSFGEERQVKFREKVLALPRASASAAILIK